MSMEAVRTARATRARLMNPPGGRESSDLEIVSEAETRRHEREQYLLRKREREEREHEARLAAIVAETKRRKEEYRQAEIALELRLAARGLTVMRVIDVCCEHFGVPALEVISTRRHASICYVRHIVAYFCCHHTRRSLNEIGRCLGGRDHTTIHSSRNKITAFLADGDNAVTYDVAHMENLLGIR